MSQNQLLVEEMHRLSVVGRHGGVVFVRLPQELWESCGPCHCPYCSGKEGFWDTLAVPVKGDKRAWTCHHPEQNFEGETP